MQGRNVRRSIIRPDAWSGKLKQVGIRIPEIQTGTASLPLNFRFNLRLQFELASGRVFLASDHPDASRPLFQQVADDAHLYGFVGLEFADDLALAEFANKTKHGSPAQMELRALQKSASSKGFGLIAHKAYP